MYSNIKVKRGLGQSLYVNYLPTVIVFYAPHPFVLPHFLWVFLSNLPGAHPLCFNRAGAELQTWPSLETPLCSFYAHHYRNVHLWEPRMCRALGVIRILRIITKLPMIRNGTSSRLSLRMFSPVGDVWHAEEDTSWWVPCILHGGCMHNVLVYAGEVADKRNMLPGQQETKSNLNCAHHRHYLRHLPTP